MWHEARRQEKAVRHKMIDSAKRHERRKHFYESVRREPNEFMQVHGQVMPIHVDIAIAEAAESPNILRKWQGDDNILIDRFDVRVHLEQINDGPSKQAKRNLLKDDVMELQCDYERYRILVFNEFKKVNETSFLSQIASKEFWPTKSFSLSSTYKKEREKKKNMTDKRAAIAFTYGDSEVIRSSNNKDWKERRVDASSSEDDELDEPEDLDPAIDTSLLNAESSALLNKIGTKYNITSGAFLQLLNMDQKEQTSTAQIKEIDKAKLALSGRHAKADRAILKRRRAMIIGNLGSALQSNEEATTTLLSFLSSANKNALKEETSSDSGEDFERTEFITCFGDDDEKNIGRKNNSLYGPDENDGEKGIVHGPVLPTKEYRRLLELSRRKSISPDSQWNCHREGSRRERRSGSLSPRSPRKKRRRSRSRSSSTSSRYRKKRERCSRSPSRGDRRENRKKTSNTRRCSTSRSYNRRCRSYSSSHSPPSKRNNARNSSNYKRNNERSITIEQTNNISSKQFHSIANDNSSSPLSSSDDSPLRIFSSMSETEKEKIERSNRKRRIRRTKRMVKDQQLTRELGNQQESEAKAEKAAKKLRIQMRKALTKTAAQFKEEGEQRHKEMLREKRQREEQLIEESRILRQREREKRRALDEDREHHRIKERNNQQSISTTISSRRRRYSSSNSD